MITSGIQSFALSHGEQYKHGRTSLRDLSGKLPFVANGCTMLLCVEGRAVVTTNTRKRTFRKGDLLVLFSDTLFAPLCVSPSFTAEYISLSLELTGEIFYKMTSPAFWDGLYEYPVCRLSEAQYSLADGVFKQMIWAMENGDEESRKNILQNCIYNVFLALDIVFKPMFPDLGKCYQKDQSRVLFGKFMSLLAMDTSRPDPRMVHPGTVRGQRPVHHAPRPASRPPVPALPRHGGFAPRPRAHPCPRPAALRL